jgi:hypothetical protein
VLDHLPLTWNRFQRLGDGLAQLAQPAAAAAQASCRPGTITRSRGRCSGNGLRAVPIPVTDELKAALDAAPRKSPIILTNSEGKRRSRTITTRRSTTVTLGL